MNNSEAPKILFMVMDGLGDRPHPKLDGKTPLEAAHTPNMDHLAQRGMTGLMYTIKPGITPGSDTSHLSLFGYDPEKYYSGRGPFEAAGVGIDVQAGDVAFRANLATISPDGIVVDRRAGRITGDRSEIEELVNSIEIPGVEIIFKLGIEHRGALVLRGENLSHKVTANDPKKTGIPEKQIRPLSPDAKRTADVLNLLLAKLKNELPHLKINSERKSAGLPIVNTILLRGAGKMVSIPTFKEKHSLNASCVCGGGLYEGIARVLGMNINKNHNGDGTAKTDVKSKVNAVLESLKTSDFVFFHIKGTDSLGHDGKALEKKNFLERVDAAISPFLDLENVIIMITGDHSTPCVLYEHSVDPVPILVAGPNLRRDHVKRFNEIDVSCGSFHIRRGLDLMPLLKGFIGVTKKYGA